MKFKIIIFVALTIFSFIKSSTTQPEFKSRSGHDEYIPYQGDNLDSFDWKLSQQILSKDTSNIIMSPFSVKVLLNLLAEATANNTDTQRELAIISTNDIRSHSANRIQFDKIFQSLNVQNDDFVFKMGTKVFVDKAIDPQQKYSAIIERYYNTIIEQLDFKNTEGAANAINNWSSDVTNGHISKIIHPGDISNAVMIMLNAIYFQGKWEYPFPENETSSLPFHLSSSQQVQSTYMIQTGRFYYLDSAQLNSKIIRLPYSGKKFSMFVVLPNSIEGLDTFISQLDSTTLRKAEWVMDKVDVKVTLPKFKYEYWSQMNEVLKDLGIREIFTTHASLPLLARGAQLENQLHVTGVIQKAGIQIDEKGSTVYAATEVTLVNKFGETGPTYEFNANHPFLFFIQDETTGALLFAGKVSNPDNFE